MSHIEQSKWKKSPRKSLRADPDVTLANLGTRAKPGYSGKKRDGKADLANGLDELSSLQEKLFADSHVAGERHDAVLLVLQAMDSAGKGGIVRHVVGGVDPQGVELAAFKKPTAEELSHHFLWRIKKRVPAPGFIGVFDRSHYEDVLIGRVRELAPADEIEKRYDEINAWEQELVDSGVRVVKVMLHLSSDEQRDRLLRRLDREDKHWKYNPGDVDERKLWPQYQEAYQIMLERTSTPHAPWYVVPADRKWFARLSVQQILLEVLQDIDPQWPKADYDIAVEKKRLAES